MRVRVRVEMRVRVRVRMRVRLVGPTAAAVGAVTVGVVARSC